MEQEADRRIDLRGVACPMNWVKARLALDELDDGQRLEVVLDDGDPVRGVMKSIKIEGHRVVRVAPIENAFLLLIERGSQEQR